MDFKKHLTGNRSGVFLEEAEARSLYQLNQKD